MVNMQIYKTLRKFPTVQAKWTYAIQTQPAPLHVRQTREVCTREKARPFSLAFRSPEQNRTAI